MATYYYKLDVIAICDNVKSNLGLPLTGVDEVTIPEFGLQTPSALSEYEKGQLDQAMADRGYKFDREES